MSCGSGFCNLHVNLMTGNAIAIRRPDAPACRQWKGKEDANDLNPATGDNPLGLVQR
jgi:hypothetical protein